jgi:hypothetical protein
VEVFEYALDSTSGEDLHRVLWLKSRNSEVWLDRRTTYTRSTAVMSMTGYLLGGCFWGGGVGFPGEKREGGGRGEQPSRSAAVRTLTGHLLGGRGSFRIGEQGKGCGC